MIIGIIGASLSGLIAGKTLAEEGHEVIVFDKSMGYGGRMATSVGGNNSNVKFDHETSYLHAESDEFKAFIHELESQGLVEKWCEHLSFSDGDTFSERYPGKEKTNYYMAPNGMASIGKYLSRWLDFRLGVPVSGMTFIGANRQKKRNWMITLNDFNTVELDAIIVALPAVQANGVVQTSQDELSFRQLVQTINRVEYDACISLTAGYGKREIPAWKGIVCQDERIKWISNESSKRDNGGELGLVIQSTPEFARKHAKSDTDKVVRLMLERAGVITGPWAGKPDWHDLHVLKYDQPRTSLKVPYLELDHVAPIALVGDYFGKQTLESAYLSGLNLARHWAKKYEPDIAEIKLS